MSRYVPWSYRFLALRGKVWLEKKLDQDSLKCRDPSHSGLRVVLPRTFASTTSGSWMPMLL